MGADTASTRSPACPEVVGDLILVMGACVGLPLPQIGLLSLFSQRERGTIWGSGGPHADHHRHR
ncbi:hypothetical protein CRG98_040691 [Punica granatum]|uniref:Uncharacterized protein n=1 Tax=Punica granatum TaxID=22663 RepID=A0A2I0I4I3_PUNGR|nr:hypothetical protein CRG98_040691 [Punica granatum]